MVTKARKDKATEKRRRVKVGELKLNKETIQDLSGSQQKQIKGGIRGDTRVWRDSDGTVCCTFEFCQGKP